MKKKKKKKKKPDINICCFFILYLYKTSNIDSLQHIFANNYKRIIYTFELLGKQSVTAQSIQDIVRLLLLQLFRLSVFTIKTVFLIVHITY